MGKLIRIKEYLESKQARKKRNTRILKEYRLWKRKPSSIKNGPVK